MLISVGSAAVRVDITKKLNENKGSG